MGALRVLAVDGSPTGGGRTAEALAAVLEGASAVGADIELSSLGADGTEGALAKVRGADAFVFGSPVHRGSFASPMKALLDHMPRGMWGEDEQPVSARAVAIVMTGASWHHYLAMNDLRAVLAGFFAAHVLTPGVYVPAEGFADDQHGLIEPFARLAYEQGTALVDLARAIAGSTALQGVRPQA